MAVIIMTMEKRVISSEMLYIFDSYCYKHTNTFLNKSECPGKENNRKKRKPMFLEASAICQIGSLQMSEMIMYEMSHMGYSLKSPVILPHDPASPIDIYFPVSLFQNPLKRWGRKRLHGIYLFTFFDLVTGTSGILKFCLLKGSECSQS